MKLTAEQLKEIVEEHRKWLQGKGGTGAVLRDADLRGADLTGAVLRGADLTGAVLIRADLRDADLRGADLTRADLRDAVGVSAPKISSLDAKILKCLDQPGCSLRMDTWHGCETTHCRAGWAITLAGDAGRMLEDRIGPAAAGALIYAASRPGKLVPDFYASNEEALEDMRRCAAEDAAAQPASA